MNNLKKRLVSLGMFFVLTATTFLSGAGSFMTHAAESEDVIVTASAWAYGGGSMDTAKTYSGAGYQYATVITGSNNTYSGSMMMDADLSIYSTFRFALKSDGSAYYEIGKTADNSYNLTAGNSADWTEIKFADEGNGYYQCYINGNWQNIQLPLDTNLSDLQMKFAASGTLVITEVRGTMREGGDTPLSVVKECINEAEGTAATAEMPVQESTKLTQISTTWSYADMPDVDLTNYKKLVFYARNVSDGAAYLEMKIGTVENYCVAEVYKSWTEVKLVKNADNTWNVYLAGSLKAENQNIINLNQIQVNYGTGSYYFSELFGVDEEHTERFRIGDVNKDKSIDVCDLVCEKKAVVNYSADKYNALYDLAKDNEIDSKDVAEIRHILLYGDTMVTLSAWAYGGGNIDDSVTYATKGYGCATVIAGSGNTYSGARMMDADLSLYSSFRFAIKSDGSAWYEIGKVANNNYNLIAGNSADWTEIKFVDEGNGYYQGYINGNWQNIQLPLDTNLSDLQMKFAASGTLVITEVRGNMREEVESSLSVVKDCINEEEGTAATVEMPIQESIKLTQISTTWSYAGMPDVDLTNYKKLVFYARNASDGIAYLEMKIGTKEIYCMTEVYKSWTEVKLVKNADNTWNVYLAGSLKAENQNIINLNQIQVNYGTNSYYFSELFAVFQ